MTDNFYKSVKEILRAIGPFLAIHVFEEDFFNRHL
jgi:hypothetical protein